MTRSAQKAPHESTRTDLIIDLQAARSLQLAGRYETARTLTLFLAGIAGLVAFLAEMRSWFLFGDWLNAHEWTEHAAVENFVNWLLQVFPLLFLVFGVWGIIALFMEDAFSKAIRFLFLMVAVPMLGLPLRNGDWKRVSIIGICVVLYFACRFMANWFADQTPLDWRVILGEKKQQRLDPEEFALALTQGRASDGSRLAILTSPDDPYPCSAANQGRSDDPAVLYQPSMTLYRLILRSHLHPSRSLHWRLHIPSALAECSQEEQAILREHGIRYFVHPEIAERVRKLLGERA